MKHVNKESITGHFRPHLRPFHFIKYPAIFKADKNSSAHNKNIQRCRTKPLLHIGAGYPAVPNSQKNRQSDCPYPHCIKNPPDFLLNVRHIQIISQQKVTKVTHQNIHAKAVNPRLDCVQMKYSCQAWYKIPEHRP